MFEHTVAASSWCPINAKSPNVQRENSDGVVAQKNTHHASKYFRVYKIRMKHDDQNKLRRKGKYSIWLCHS
jgi:hypothetical protein